MYWQKLVRISWHQTPRVAWLTSYTLFGLGLGRQAVQFDDWPDFDGAPASAGNPRRDPDRVVQAIGVDKVITAKLLVRFRERSVGDEPFAVANPNACRRSCRMQRRRAKILPLRVDVPREAQRLRIA